MQTGALPQIAPVHIWIILYSFSYYVKHGRAGKTEYFHPFFL